MNPPTAPAPVPVPGPGPRADTATRGARAPAGPEALTGGTTVYFGRIFPAVWTTVVGALTGAVWLDLLPGATAPTVVKWALLSVWVAISTLLITHFGRLRHVWQSGDELIVGDPGRGLRIHLSDVREIKESHFQQVKTITLKLRRPTPLGDSISFVPKGAGPFFFPLMSSSVARRLRERHEELAAEQYRLGGNS